MEQFTVQLNNATCTVCIGAMAVVGSIRDGIYGDYSILLAKGILSKCEYGFKVLGNGKVTKKVTVEASAFSASAKEAIEAAGGKAEVK